MNLSANLTLQEACYSRKAKELKINNEPNEKQIANLKILAENIIEPLTKEFGQIYFTSMFRNLQLNTALKGATNSRHMQGQAVDIVSVDLLTDLAGIYKFIVDNLLFDKIIWELGNIHYPQWVHVSSCFSGNRCEQWSSFKTKNGIKYTKIS